MQNNPPIGIVIALVFPLGFIFALLLIAYDEGRLTRWFFLFKCKSGRHKFTRGFLGKTKTYYCERCRKPRRHPMLKVVDGGQDN
jgi:hypothetical protein